MNLWQECRKAFGKTNIDLDFRGKMTALLRTWGIEAHSANATYLRENKISVKGGNPPVEIKVCLSGGTLQVVGQSTGAASNAPPLNRGANGYG